MKPILWALVLVPVMQAVALAQAPTADAKEGRLYVDGGIAFGVASMAAPSDSRTGFDSIPVFGFGLAAEYGITEQIGVFTRMGLGVGLSSDPDQLGFGMMFDGAYKLVEKKADVPAVIGYVGMGFAYIDVDPKSSLGLKDDSQANFVAEFGVQADFGPGDWSLQPFMAFQLMPGKRPFKGYNGILQLVMGAKFLYKLTEQLYLEPSVTFTGGNFQDSVMFGFGVQLRL
jgi:hypothetical protein